MTRLVVLLGCVAALATGCRGDGRRAQTRLRLGFFPTLTQAVALVMASDGRLERAIAPLPLDLLPFNAGPEAMEALFAGAIDACYVGALPALNAYLRSDGRALVLVAGAATGGAAFVVGKDSGITGPESLHEKKLASPQLGNTQDVALRSYLEAHGLKPRELGGDVQVMPISNPDILSLMRLGRLDGAWVVEPWVARLTHEAGARVLLDEKDLWPNGLYPTAVLVVTRTLAREHPDLVKKLLGAHVETIRWANAHRDEARELAGQAILKYAKKALPREILAEAWQRVQLDYTLPSAQLEKIAADARRLDYLPATGDVRAALDGHFLDEAIRP